MRGDQSVLALNVKVCTMNGDGSVCVRIVVELMFAVGVVHALCTFPRG